MFDLQAIIDDKPVIVSGEEAKRALATAIKITQVIHHTNELYPMLQD